MRPRPTYALPSYPSAAPGAHLHLLLRARAARTTCPTPGVTRDPPAQAPAGTFRPGGRPEPPPVHKPDERTGHHLSVAMSLRHHEARHRAAPEVEYERLRALRS